MLKLLAESRKRRKTKANIKQMKTSFQTAFAMEQEKQPSFRRHVDDRRYYEVPARFPFNTAYMEVLILYGTYISLENSPKKARKLIA